MDVSRERQPTVLPYGTDNVPRYEQMPRPRHGIIVTATLVTLAVMWPLGWAQAGQEFELRAISSRPDTVSGGDVLVQVNVPSRSNWDVQLDGRDVTSSFRAREVSNKLLALLTGLKIGKNVVEVRVDGSTKSKLEIVGHPLAGPIFSGPRQEPFICQTGDNGLGPPADLDCNSKTIVQYYYKSTELAQKIGPDAMIAALGLAPGSLMPGFKVYDLSGLVPSDVAQTVTTDGQAVPYIVRRELGTINRAIYDIQFLHRPGQPLPTPWTHPTPGWNGRLVYVFGGGCGPGYHQGTLGIVGRSQEPLLAQGYAIATSTLNIFGVTCNDRVSAETLSKVKEHFIKQYGEPLHTIGWGGSGGAMQLYLTAQNYPGLLDGIVPSMTFSDMPSDVQLDSDCSLLDQAFETTKLTWTERQKTAVSGFATWRTCSFARDSRGHPLATLDPRNCDPSVRKELIYDRATNPKGARCDLYDNEINIFGRNPNTGFAYRPLDNVGVQYGLAAFNSGKIDAEHFIDLNERIGGYDEDGHIVGTRTQADLEALRIAYQRGLVLTGGGGLSQVPIIDWHLYGDDLANAHDLFRSFATRARLIAANGNADNQVILIDPRSDLWIEWDTPVLDRERDLMAEMDRWLDNIAADRATGTMSAKVARNKPSGVADGCRATDGERIVEPATYEGSGSCNDLYPPHADPRIAAGGPLTDDVLKCELKPISAADYSRPLTPHQLRRLKAIFPDGVCDYSRRGIGQGVTLATWQSF